MLVLTRKQQEQIQVGDNVTITILKVQGRTVRLGIEAPRQVRVVRSELPRLEQAPEPPIAAEAATETPPACPSVVRHDRQCRRRGELHDPAEPIGVSAADRAAVASRPLSLLVRNSCRAGSLAAVAK